MNVYLYILKIEYCSLDLHGVPGNRIITVGKIYAALLMIGNYRSYKETLAKENVFIQFFFI